VHCGEFLDGRPKTQESVANLNPAQQTFIIEKAMISTGGGLPPGMQAQGLGAPQQSGGSSILDASRRQFIEFDPNAGKKKNSPPEPIEVPIERAIQRQETLALPAPKDAPTHDDDEPLPIVGEGEKKELALREATPVAIQPAQNLPAVASTTSLAPARQGGDNLPAVRENAMLPVLRGAAKLISRAFKAATAKDDTVDAEFNPEEDKYRVCGLCQTEILATDHFCYHCGQQYAERPRSSGVGRRRSTKSNILLYMIIIVCWGGVLLSRTLLAQLDEQTLNTIRYSAAIAGPVFSMVAFLRKPGFFSRIFALLFVGASVWVDVLEFFRK